MTWNFEENWLKKGRKDYIESFKLLGKKPFLPVPHSSKTAYECLTITSINSDIFSLLGYITNTVSFNFNCCLFILICEKKCPHIQISVHWKSSFHVKGTLWTSRAQLWMWKGWEGGWIVQNSIVSHVALEPLSTLPEKQSVLSTLIPFL